jgi:hypothetical protein
MPGARENARLAWGLLASFALLALPGARAVWTWPALFALPGAFLAWRALGLRGWALLPAALVLSLALSPIACLPSLLALHRLEPAALAAGLAVLCACCMLLPARAPEPRAALSPPPAYLAALGALFAWRVIVALGTREPWIAHPDGPFFVGMVRGLAAAFPPENFEAAGVPQMQPWGYWLLYAAAHVASGLPIATVLGLSSAVLFLAFATASYAVVLKMTGSRLAAVLTLPLLCASGHARGALLGFAAWRVDVGVLADATWYAFYNGPPLLLMLGVLALLAAACEERSDRLLPWASLLLAVSPWFHPTYFIETALVALFACAHGMGRGQLGPRALGLVATPLPFLASFTLGYGDRLFTRFPFHSVTDEPYAARELAANARFLIAHDGLWLVPALVGAAVVARGRAWAIALLGVCVGLALFAVTVVPNYHWVFDPLGVACALLSACALGWAAERRARVGRALSVVFVLCLLVRSGWERRIANDVAGMRGERNASESQRALAAWIAAHTPESAVFLVPANDLGAAGAVLGLAERRLFFGFRNHLDRTLQPDRVRDLETANEEMLKDPSSPRLSASMVDYVVQDVEVDPAAYEAWRNARAPLFEAGPFALWPTPRVSPQKSSF